tara:strand:+ start:3332 stop:4327 length:996 start_codon:yes stop_codon:yes gene_type:complete
MLSFSNTLIVPKFSSVNSRKQVNLNRKFEFKNSNNKWTGVPIIASNMDTIGTFEMEHYMSESNMMTCLHKHYLLSDYNNHYYDAQHDNLIISTGIANDDIYKLEQIMSENKYINWICVDVANGYTNRFFDVVRYIRNMYPDKVLIAGNVVTPDATSRLFENGVDIAKIGIGPGSACATREKTGIGFPQLQAVVECSEVAKAYGNYIISDGGCKCTGDIVKALGGGADFVMLGGMLAGHDETSETFNEDEDGEVLYEYYGMSSTKAMNKYNGGHLGYRASEGKRIKIKSKGSIRDTLRDIKGGIKSACTYVGYDKIEELSNKGVQFVESEKL